MIVYKDYVSFKILGSEVNLITENFDHGLHTVAEIGSRYYHLGNEPCNLTVAISAWQRAKNKILSSDEIDLIYTDNAMTNG